MNIQEPWNLNFLRNQNNLEVCFRDHNAGQIVTDGAPSDDHEPGVGGDDVPHAGGQGRQADGLWVRNIFLLWPLL